VKPVSSCEVEEGTQGNPRVLDGSKSRRRHGEEKGAMKPSG